MKKSLISAFLTISCVFAMSCGNNEATTTDSESTSGELAGSLSYEYVIHYTDGTESGVVRYDDLSTMLLGLDRGDIDYIPLSKSVAEYIANTQGDGKYVVETSNPLENYSLGVGEAHRGRIGAHLPQCSEVPAADGAKELLTSLKIVLLLELFLGLGGLGHHISTLGF